MQKRLKKLRVLVNNEGTLSRALFHPTKGLCPAVTAAEVTVIGEDEVEVHGNTCTLRVSQTIIITAPAGHDEISLSLIGMALNIPEEVYITSSDPSPSFTWNAADYHKSSASQQQWAQELIAKLGLRGNEQVLDIGCGDGKVTAEIAHHLTGGNVTGVDSSPEMIGFACDHFPQTEYRNLSFVQMDARALSFTKEFDVVFSSAALHWIFDHKPVLAGIARSLLPGGRLLIQMGGKGNADKVFGVLEVLLESPRWSQYFNDFSFAYGFFDQPEYRQWLTETGFESVRVDLIPKEITYSSREDFAAWIRTTWLPWMARLPEGERTDFINALIDEYLVKYPAGIDRMIHIRMVRLEASAKKRT